jgi:hypothetical protein
METARDHKYKHIKENTMAETPIEKYPGLEPYLETLKRLRKDHYPITAEMLSVANGDMFATDFVMLGILNRSINLLDGITCLLERWNFTAAVPLLRLQLDSLLRLCYLASLTDVEEVSIRIIKGKSFLSIKDKEGQKLTDVRLRKYASNKYPWVDNIYKETSKMIHLSDKHCFLATDSIDEEERSVTFCIGEGDHRWSEPEIAKFLATMGKVTKALLEHIVGWTVNKQRGFDENNME